MRQRFRLYRRGKVFWCQDNETNRQESLRTKDRGEARTLLQARNDVYRQPAMNLQLARVYLQHGDPLMAERTWPSVTEAIVSTKSGPTKERWIAAAKDQALDPLRNRKLLETTAEHFLRVLNSGTVSTNVFLRRIHNFALDMNWLAAPIIPKRQWPPVQHKEKRAITSEEHRRIQERERNPEWQAYYGLIWHLGGAQTDIAKLDAQAVDWQQRTIAYTRRKTSTPVVSGNSNDVQATAVWLLA